MLGYTRVGGGIAGTIFTGLIICLLAGMAIGADATPAMGQLRISLVIPERATIVAPAIELTGHGSPRLCNTHQGDSLREIRHEDSQRHLPHCSSGGALAQASGRHQVLITPI